MNTSNWSLNELYPSFKSTEFENDFHKLKEEISLFKSWTKNNLLSNENPLSKIEFYINLQNGLSDLSSKLYDFAQLKLSTNSNDEAAVKILDKLEEEFTELTEPNVKFEKWLCQLKNPETIISSSPLLKEHEFFLMEIINQGKYTLSEEQEIIISKMKNTGSSAWSKLHQMLTASLMVDITLDGENKQLPLSSVRNLAYEQNTETRKTAYNAELAAYKKIDESAAACLNGIKGEVITLSKLRGYESPLHMTLINSRLNKKTLDVMLSAIKENLFQFERYFLKKAEITGYSNGLPFYELFAPIGKVEMKFTYEEAQKFIIENFSTFSQKLGDYAENAFKKNWIDVYPKQGKSGGAFCSNLHSIGESRILTNFTGSFSDVITLAHELGHGYHGSCLDKQTALNSDYPMPIAETASTFCETIVKNAALKTASPEECKIILESDISDNAQVIVDIYSRFIFEDTVFSKRKDGSLSSNELSEIMLSAQAQAYGAGLDKNHLHKFMWVCKTHYYDAGYNYYNFPYAFGLLFAKGLYSQYLNDKKDFPNKYDNLLSYTGSASIEQVAAMANIDINKINFWQSSLELIKNDIDKFCNL